jgi:nitroreductase
MQRDGYPFVSYEGEKYSPEESLKRCSSFYEWINTRRSVREFSSRPFDRAIIDQAIMAASTAPSGAHKQPWSFCVVTDPELKRRIRDAAEKEEHESYHGRMSGTWLEDLKPLQTDWRKPFLEDAPYLIVVFKRVYETLPDGSRRNNYYVNESVGLACGMLLAAIHTAGLAALTHTPSPMYFLSEFLNRPDNERPFLLIPVGYHANETYVPDLKRKSLEEIVTYYQKQQAD